MKTDKNVLEVLFYYWNVLKTYLYNSTKKKKEHALDCSCHVSVLKAKTSNW